MTAATCSFANRLLSNVCASCRRVNGGNQLNGPRVSPVRHFGRLASNILNRLYNRYDARAVAKHGAELSCADWLLKCGSPHVRLAGPFVSAASAVESQQQHTHRRRGGSRLDWRRNEVLVASRRHLWKIAAEIQRGKPELLSTVTLTGVDASDSIISYRAAQYFQGLSALRALHLHHCDLIDDKFFLAITERRSNLRRTLEALEVTAPDNVTDEGLRSIVRLAALRRLRIYIVPTVRQPGVALARFRHSLPHCADLVLQPTPSVVRDFASRYYPSSDGFKVDVSRGVKRVFATTGKGR